MKYIITERQLNLLKEEEILEIPFEAFDNNWNLMQKFLEKRNYPPYKITRNLDLRGHEIKSLGNLISVGGYLDLYGTPIESLGKLQYVGGYLDLYETPIKSLGKLQSVGGFLDLSDTPISKTTTEEEIRSYINVSGNIFI